MKTNTIKNLLPTLYVCLFFSTIAGCNTKNKPSTTSIAKIKQKNKRSDKNGGGDAPTGTDQNSGESTTLEPIKMVGENASTKNGEEDVPTRTDKKSTDSPPLNTKNLQELVEGKKVHHENTKAPTSEELLQKVKQDCDLIQEILNSSQNALQEEKKYLTTVPQSLTPSKAIQKGQKEKNVQDRLAKSKLLYEELENAKQAIATAETSAKEIVGECAQEANDLITIAKNNLKKAQQNYKKITKLIADIQNINVTTKPKFSKKNNHNTTYKKRQ